MMADSGIREIARVSTACYRKPFLKQVIARVDFVTPVVPLEKHLPAKLAKMASSYFPISEPMDGITKQFRLDNGGIQETQTPFKQWIFFGKEREKQLTISPTFMSLIYTKYTTYDEMKSHFSDVVDEIAKAFPDAKASRFGLRFINIIDGINVPSPTDWNLYIAEEILCMAKFFSKSPSLTRLMHVAEMRDGEVDVRFQFGMPNPDYPAIMKRPMFALDLDAYVNAAHELSESSGYMGHAHQLIQDLFERSIKDKLRVKMNAK